MDHRARGIVMIVLAALLLTPVGLIILLRMTIPQPTIDRFGRHIPGSTQGMAPANVMLLTLFTGLALMLLVYGITMYRSGKTNFALGCITGGFAFLFLMAFGMARSLRLI